MKKTKKIILSLATAQMLLVESAFAQNKPVAQALPMVSRPTQYIALSFDGSKSLERWRTTRQFAKDNNLKFTYFISGVYYLNQNIKNEYTGPGHTQGHSDIGFGADAADIKTRIQETLKTQQAGNEIGSHVNGHFDGKAWSYDQWASEFRQFSRFLTDVFSLNKIVDATLESSWLDTLKASIKGFRAPLLGYNQDMYKVMADNNMTFDSSQAFPEGAWPKKRPESDIWVTALHTLPLAGTAKKTLSMDYNFYYSQSAGVDDSAKSDFYSKQMLDSYYAHFAKSYNGNRAPIVIGHHFSNWNGAAYWTALQKFAKQVCNMPEVKCVTHSELVEFLNENVGNIASYQVARFPPVEQKFQVAPVQTYDVQMNMAQNPVTGGLQVAITGAQSFLAKDAELSWTIDGQEIPALRNQYKFNLREAVLDKPDRIRAALIKNGVELQSVTHKLKYDDYNDIKLDGPAVEIQAMMGDMPEAHFEDAH